jgi:carboxyl-terminal processing protease
MNKKYSFTALIFSGIAGVLICVLVLFVLFTIKFGGDTDRLAAASKFAIIYKTIEDQYIGDADMEEVSNAAYSAMVEATGDRWSYYMTADDYIAYIEYQSNSYTGIGVSILSEEGSEYLTVKGVNEDSPASRAGIQIGDKLISIGGKSLKGLTANEVKEIIAEQNGNAFELELLTAEGESVAVTVSTEVVSTNPVKYELMENGIGYIRIKNFEDGSGINTVSAVDDLIGQGATAIIFDVRNNPGGKLSELLTALDHLLPEGEVFVNVDAKGNETVRYSDAECVEIPMAVLVNANTYSAAEFFAEALSEYKVADVIGSKTTGKSRSQVTLVLGDGSAVHLSTNGYLTPQRKDLAAQGGITPDVEIDLDETDAAYLAAGQLDFAEDEQLQAAILQIVSARVE